jgi:ubiquitin-protein ligase
MSIRLRRLMADHDKIQQAFTEHPQVRLLEAEGSPPERYRFELTVQGLVETDGKLERVDAHRVEVFLPLDYPRSPPFCRMLSPVYHPNIDPQKICIGDHWSAGQSLTWLVARIGEMICFQSYNTKSPLNARAAAWAEQHIDELPLDRADLFAGL